ncbi:MAG: hypothetical protein PWP24_36 [Clostridiales bacterium]|nr:hypothetical protein [Clostridiales bacterium]
MSEGCYMISDAAKRLKVESHALRYWEEELSLDIPRNEMGHRQYTEDNMKLLQNIKKLKEKGFHLKAIKLLLPKIEEVCELDEVSLYRIREELNERAQEHLGAFSLMKVQESKLVKDGEPKMQQFKSIMKELILEALKENNETLCDNVGNQVSENVIKEMDYLLRTQEEKEEERFRKFDEVMRNVQKVRQEVAATEALSKKKKKSGFLGRKKQDL